MTAILSAIKPTRRPGELGVHSVDRFHFAVPDLAVAKNFYGEFGLEIDEQKQIKRIFSGWMFADSPGLHGVEHPIFDIWLTACKGGTVVIHDAPMAEASAPNPDESPPTDPGADAASPEQTPPPAQAAKKKKPKPPTVVAAPAPDGQPTTPFEPAPNPSSTTGNARAR